MDLTRHIPTLDEAHRWYTEADAAHDFDHIVRVYHLALRLAKAEGADLEIVQAAALLHDIKGSTPGSKEREIHHLLSAEVAGDILAGMNWAEVDIHRVQHCIRAHRFRDESEQPLTIEAKVLYDADKLDVLGAIGVVRTIAYSVLAGEPVYSKPSESFINTRKKEKGEPHSSYHEYLFKLSHIRDRLMTVTGKSIAESRHDYMEGFFQRLIQEMNGSL